MTRWAGLLPSRSDTSRRDAWAIDVLALHSPLVGPSTIRPLADALDAVGWSTTVLDLRHSLTSPEAYIATVERAVGTVDVIIGHSGAGAFLPTIAANTDGISDRVHRRSRS